ncbi:hypothetical protein OPV22_008949 [Ensete ventricosum]|uniref:Uncharacterized protein n=1 Tax=Ensete ventricosum TaxID=4639 RepID=A0AAV8RC89_ENSVE|nr:hypothetical protein OPV22_008949 [Ensete ventricosum]
MAANAMAEDEMESALMLYDEVSSPFQLEKKHTNGRLYAVFRFPGFQGLDVKEAFPLKAFFSCYESKVGCGKQVNVYSQIST